MSLAFFVLVASIEFLRLVQLADAWAAAILVVAEFIFQRVVLRQLRLGRWQWYLKKPVFSGGDSTPNC